MGEDTRRWVLPAELQSAGRARWAIVDALTAWELVHYVNDVRLVTSELVANAVLHAGTEVDLRLGMAEDVVRLEVLDGSRAFPRMTTHLSEGLTGRGLHLVDRVAPAWGATYVEGGKVVWAEFGDRPRVPRDLVEATSSEDLAQPDGAHHVFIPDVPVSMIRRWGEHIDDLHREATLVSLSARSGVITAPSSQVARTIDELYEAFTTARVVTVSQARAAAASGQATFTLDLELPMQAAGVGRILMRLLDEADELSAAGLLLTPESSDELKEFRRRTIGEVISQLERAL